MLDKHQPYKNLDKLREKVYSCAFYIESSVELPAQNDRIWEFKMPQKTEKLYHEVLDEKAAEYEALQLSANSAARRGYVDQIVEAADTRKYVIGAFEMLFTKSEDRPVKKHGTV